MDYNTLITSIQKTKGLWANSTKPGPTYEELLSRGHGYWLNLNALSRVRLETDVIDGFLNTPKWFCHLPPPKSPERASLLNSLGTTLSTATSYYSALKGVELTNIDFASFTTVNGKSVPFAGAINDLYVALQGVGNHFRRVAASKLMNMALPDLLMMWDKNIIAKYRVRKQTAGADRIRSYVAFVILMQENIRHVTATSPTTDSGTSSALLANINQRCGYSTPLPITRLLDVANYSVTPCPSCIKNAEVTIAALSTTIPNLFY